VEEEPVQILSLGAYFRFFLVCYQVLGWHRNLRRKVKINAGITLFNKSNTAVVVGERARVFGVQGPKCFGR